MIRTIAVDTNVLLDYLLKRDPGFSKSFQLLKDCSAGKAQIFIPSIVFPEIEWVLRSFYKQSKQFIIKFLDGLLSLDGVLTEGKDEMQHALNCFRQTNIKFTDSIVITQVQKFQPDEFLTFDKDLQKFYQKES